ncbi:MAG TPA: HEAT repeat domain-containing protein [Fimbriimonadaceae bacterium]|nr:HEAT repeat domain-containing protein [Fimbriimonadaceae bacterium]
MGLAFALASCGPAHRPKASLDPAAASREQKQIAALIDDLGVPVEGLHGSCMPYPHSKADDAYAGLLKIGAPAVPALIDVLADSNVYRRAHAAGLLGEIGDPRAVPPLDARLDKEVDANGWVIDAVGNLHDPRSVDALVPLLSKGSGVIHSLPATVPTVGQRAAYAIAEIGKPAKARLMLALRSSNPDTRANAKFALDRLSKRAG